MRVGNDQIITNGSMTGTSTINSDPFWVGQAIGYAVQAVWSGTPTGTIKLQASIDAVEPNPSNSNEPATITNWEDITDSSYSITGSAGTYTWNVTDVFYRWVRVVYVNSSSTGTLNARFNTKGF